MTLFDLLTIAVFLPIYCTDLSF
jgi:hypothetical protein